MKGKGSSRTIEEKVEEVLRGVKMPNEANLWEASLGKACQITRRISVVPYWPVFLLVELSLFIVFLGLPILHSLGMISENTTVGLGFLFLLLWGLFFWSYVIKTDGGRRR